MNKELFVSSTPHETKVGLVEDDLLAEVYLERENEYTLAGSIYKGRVTRVLPGMQSAFVDIGLERDAFLYVSDFMELEEHDDDLTDVIPATRSVPDMRQPPAQAEAAGASDVAADTEGELAQVTDEGAFEADALSEGQPAPAGGSTDSANGADSQNRDRGGFRGRRRRRGGRRDGRGDGRDRGPDRGPERTPDRAFDRDPSERSLGAALRAPRRAHAAVSGFGRTQPSGPPPGYQPILLPGESISKYQRFAQQPPAPQMPVRQAVAEAEPETAAQSL